MNYDQFKKGIVSLTLMCVFAFSTLVGSAVPANAQGYYQGQYVYSYPYVYYPYSYYPSGYYPYGYPTSYYPYEYHHHWYQGRHHIRRAFDWLF
ncbi:MAG: hypothetical protein J2P21_04620 [Chloracidobacterium sp.]|nr:hypothetical protein [Chloracidobacterium sp.]